MIKKILMAGLIATAMFSTAASAREQSTSERHAEEHAYHTTVAPPWMLPPFTGAKTEPPEQPGDICDHGDNPQIC